MVSIKDLKIAEFDASSKILVWRNNFSHALLNASREHSNEMIYRIKTVNNRLVINGKYLLMFGAVPIFVKPFAKKLLHFYAKRHAALSFFEGEIEISCFVYWLLLARDLVDWEPASHRP